MAKVKHHYSAPEKAPQIARLTELEEKITTWKMTGKLWDYEDPAVAAILEERDSLFKEINPHLAGMSFYDMTEADYEEIDKKLDGKAEDSTEEVREEG